jgi:hypothetical protein
MGRRGLVPALCLLAFGAAGAAEPLRGLTPREVEDLREGRGMGLARAADLHGYPGPLHVLEAVEAGQLHLSPEQLRAVRGLYEAMSREARRLGAAILEEEAALEAAFRDRTVTEAELRGQVMRLAGLYGELRTVHLRTHLETRALLSQHQIQRYRELRGHAGPPGVERHGH